ncbi:class I histocompatibility antigen, Gogo-OKO alpha chain-like [Notamacropus eugenii]|uniref:class I histocompatibility antigen, Gogo-OKO alpha chain-like n=1 Tax=Notamacropus eugenii TaxID=9315 RepID=UPI003B66CA49
MEGMEQEDPGYWEGQTRTSRAKAQTFCVGLENIRGYFRVRGAMRGCEVSPELTFRRGFEKHAHDGRDYIALDTETLTWTAAVPPAVNTKRKWEEEGSIAEKWKAYLKKECVLWVKKHLEMGKETKKRTEPPSARETRHTVPNGEVTLRYQAQDFYPKEIFLTWLRDGEEQPQDTEFIETRPAGDGTFQKWAAVDVTSGQEGRYTCRVQHEGLSEPLTLQWGPESSPAWPIVGDTVVGLPLLLFLLLTAFIACFVICRRKLSGRKGGGYVLAAANDSAQRSAVSLTAKA